MKKVTRKKHHKHQGTLGNKQFTTSQKKLLLNNQENRIIYKDPSKMQNNIDVRIEIIILYK